MRIRQLLMELLTRRTVKSILLPGGAIVLASVLLLGRDWSSLSPSSVNFFYYAVFIAAALLAWRFHSTRILFSAVILLLGHRAVEFFARPHRSLRASPNPLRDLRPPLPSQLHPADVFPRAGF